MNRVVHFEIHASEPERAAKFYQTIFGWDIKEWKFSAPDGKEMEMKPENRYWMVMTNGVGGANTDNAKWPGINGGMLIRRGLPPTAGAPVNSYVCTIEVTSVDESVEKARVAGGQVALPKMAIKTVGWVAYCIDTEGNIFGLMQNDPNAQ